ncbi:MAG: alpha/beta fold hydrolase [Alphaproteobacteria bacterium]|nr:alpha/beta fold hydrolase [Alphaproteobacteria bacterium]
MSGRTIMQGALLAASLASAAPAAAQYPEPREATWVARDFRFHTGEVMPELRLGYLTIGEPSGTPVLVLHGTAGSSRSMVSPAFAGQLFGPGQALDAAKHYIIIPDALGAGKSSKPSDGLRTGFPQFNYADILAAQHRLLTEGLGVSHVRLVIGNSMGGMLAWLWGVTHPDFMDAIVPMAAQPTAMSGRNWMLRRMMIETIRRDPAYQGGNYTSQPASLSLAFLFFNIATNGGSQALQKAAPTRAAADAILDQRLAQPAAADANDLIYMYEASRDFDAEPLLGRIRARVLAINSADDERNPHETGLMAAAMARIPNARLLLIPGSTDTAGHGTTGQARFWREELAGFLKEVP